MAASATPSGERKVFVDRDMHEAELFSVAGGTAALFTARCPGKDGPNEDGAALLSIDGQRAVIVVADGVGGHPGGNSASRTALRCLERALGRLDGDASVRAAILDGLEQANHEIMDLGIGAATTIAALEVSGKRLRPYHVGDSAALVVGQRGKLKLQTISHSPVGYALESGLLDEREALHHDERHVISNMVGSADMRFEVGSPFDLAPRDTALVATDGLFDNLHLARILDIVRSGALPAVCSELARACAESMRTPKEGHPSKPDDFTFALFRPDR